jgi:hypothetical protein
VVSVIITDLQGTEMRKVMYDSPLETGYHTFPIATDGLPNGSYMVMAKTGDGRTVALQLKVVR